MKLQIEDTIEKQILSKTDYLVIGQWLNKLRLENKKMDIEIIEKHLKLKEGELLQIENGVKPIDYITLNRLIGIYSEFKEEETFQYIITNINNSLSINENSNIINTILDKSTLNISLVENKNYLECKIIEIDTEEKIMIGKDKYEIDIKIQHSSFKDEVFNIKTDAIFSFNYKSILDFIMILYRKFYFNNIRNLIETESQVLRQEKIFKSLFDNL